jgi:hypothetical protein
MLRYLLWNWPRKRYHSMVSFVAIHRTHSPTLVVYKNVFVDISKLPSAEIRALIFRFLKILLCVDYLGTQHYFGLSREESVDTERSTDGLKDVKKGNPYPDLTAQARHRLRYKYYYSLSVFIGHLSYFNRELQLRLTSIRTVVVARDAKKNINHVLMVPIFSLCLRIMYRPTHRTTHIM